MGAIKRGFEALRHSWGLFVVMAAFLTIACLTRPASLEELAGADYPQGGSFSAMDALQAVNYLPGRIQNAFNQTFAGRDGLVHAAYWVRLNLLGERDFHDVVVGQDGWLFYSGEKNLDYYQNAPLMTPVQVKALLTQLSETREALASRGIPFYVAVAPDKETIYPEYLPSGIEREGQVSLLDVLLAQNSDKKLNLIDLRPALLEAKKAGQVYYLTDTHWNQAGAFAAYQVIMKRLRADLPGIKLQEPSDFTFVPETISGDLSNMLTMKGQWNEESFELKPKFERRARTEWAGDGAYLESIVHDPSLPRVMIIHDSFYNGLMPFMGEHFRQGILVHSFRLDMDWVVNEKPDVVILEVAERYLPELLVEGE